MQQRRFPHSSVSFRLISAALLWCGVVTSAFGQENASNPLAAVNNVDLRYKFLNLGSGSDKQDFFIDGSYMVRPTFKLKYEVHYNSTDVTGVREQGFEKINLRAILFPSQRKLNASWGSKTAVGLEWIYDDGEPDKGIGTGADQLAPFFGVAFSNIKSGLTLVPLVQHFQSYNSDVDVSQTAMRLIVLQPFAKDWWSKADLKATYDWENSEWPASFELQIGKNISERFALYSDFFLGLGGDRRFEEGIGLGMRFKY